MTNLPSPYPVTGDGYDGHPIVERAWLALICFGRDLDRTTAAELLPLWRYFPELSDRERAAVVARFPAPAIPPVPVQIDGRRIGRRF